MRPSQNKASYQQQKKQQKAHKHMETVQFTTA